MTKLYLVYSRIDALFGFLHPQTPHSPETGEGGISRSQPDLRTGNPRNPQRGTRATHRANRDREDTSRDTPRSGQVSRNQSRKNATWNIDSLRYAASSPEPRPSTSAGRNGQGPRHQNSGTAWRHTRKRESITGAQPT